MSGRKDISRELSAYLDGELTRAERRRVEKAAEADAALAAELDSLRATRRLVRDLPHEAAPEGFADRVLARAERVKLMAAAPHAAGGRGPALRWATYLAAAVLLIAASAGVVVTVMLLQQSAPGDAHVATRPDVTEIAKDLDDAGKAGGVHEKALPKPAAPPGGHDESLTAKGRPREAGDMGTRNAGRAPGSVGDTPSAPVVKVTIFTNSLRDSERDLRKVLASNRFYVQNGALAVAHRDEAARVAAEAAGVAAKAAPPEMARHNFAVQNLKRPQEQEWLLYVPPTQVRQFNEDVARITAEKVVFSNVAVDDKSYLDALDRSQRQVELEGRAASGEMKSAKELPSAEESLARAEAAEDVAREIAEPPVEPAKAAASAREKTEGEPAPHATAEQGDRADLESERQRLAELVRRSLEEFRRYAFEVSRQRRQEAQTAPAQQTTVRGAQGRELQQAVARVQPVIVTIIERRLRSASRPEAAAKADDETKVERQQEKTNTQSRE
jgi:hypothetical protein